MPGTTFAALTAPNDANVRKPLKGGIIFGPMSATLPTALTSGSPPALQSLTGWTGPLGRLTTDGATRGTAVTASDTTGWGEGVPARVDVIARVRTLKFGALEVNKNVLSFFFQVDPTTLVPDATTGELAVTDTGDLSLVSYRMMLLMQDGAAGSEFWFADLLPKASITNFEDLVFKPDTAVIHGATVTAYIDSTAGYAYKNIWSGPGWLANKTAMGF
jgi:hypothetical protein